MATADLSADLLDNISLYLENFKFLNNIDVNADGVPNIQHSSVAVGVETSSASASIVSDDHKGYSYSSFELSFIVRLEREYRTGQEFVHTLYTYRSVSQAIPEIAVETHEDATPEEQAEVVAKKAEISRKVLDILRPEIAKLKDVMSYVSNAVHLYHSVISYLVQKDSHKEIIPEGIYYSLMKLLDVLIILDNIKDIKTCLQKDFSRYKRVLGAQPSIEVIEELNQLQLFLSNPDPKKSKNYIFQSLRDEVKRISNHESVLIQIIELANEALENILYLTPNEKFRLIRVQPYLMLIIDSDADDDKSPNSVNIFKTNRTKLAVIQKVFHKNPVIPLYGDMSITLEYILQRSPHYDKDKLASAWSNESANADAKVVAHYAIATHWTAIRESSTAYMLRLQAAVNRCEKYPFSKVLDEVSIEAAGDIFNLVSEGFQKLSKWTMVVQSNLVWKYTHPLSNAQLGEMKIPLNTEGLEYARVLKHNFSKTELSVLCDVISCIKAVSSLLAKYESVFAPFIRFHIHHSIQQLVQGDLVPLLHRVDKRNKPILPELLKLRTLAADYAKGVVDTQRDYKEYTRKDGYSMVSHPARVVGTSASQLYILRLQVSLLCDSQSEVRKTSSMFAKADLEKADIEIFTEFYHDSFYFPYLLDYSETLRAVSNLGSLWYREFYLEMTKCIQFPIEMSLPWILTEHIISNHTKTNSAMLSNIFLVLDIYNDAAHDALYTLHTQYLYDEIEAETNLVVDQLYFLLSDTVYSYYKNLAASELLEKSYKSRLEEIKVLVASSHGHSPGTSLHHLTLNVQQFETILQQKHVHLLGRTINFNFILGQNINNKVYRDIDLAIKRFESSDARGVIDLKQLLDIISAAHAHMSRFIQLDAFDLMLNEINESFNPSSFKGRISVHMLTSLVKDVIPNYSYNYYTERFIPSPMAMRRMDYIKGPKQSAVANAYGSLCSKAFDMQSKLTRSYFGHHHLTAFLSLGLRLTDLSMLIDQVVKNLLDKVRDISEYLEALKDSIPPCKPLAYSYHAFGSYGYYEGKLKTLLGYDDLKSEVFQNFREVGNSLALLRDLSNILDIQRQYDFNFIAPLLGLVPAVRKFNASTSEEETPAAEVVSPVEVITNHLVSEVKQNPAAQNNCLRSVDLFTRLPAAIHKQIQTSTNLFADLAEGGGGGSGGAHKTLFKFVLSQVEDYLYQQSLSTDWAVHNNSTAGVIEIANAKGFHRLWSALSFLFCMSDEAEEAASEDGSKAGTTGSISNEAEFGHGFAITGCLLLHLLNQKSVFELMDFSYYILSIHHYDQKAEYQPPTGAPAADSGGRASIIKKAGIEVAPSLLRETNSFIATASTQQMLHTELFALFEAQYNVKMSNLTNAVNKTVFHPPVEEDN